MWDGEGMDAGREGDAIIGIAVGTAESVGVDIDTVVVVVVAGVEGAEEMENGTGREGMIVVILADAPDMTAAGKPKVPGVPPPISC